MKRRTTQAQRQNHNYSNTRREEYEIRMSPNTILCHKSKPDRIVKTHIEENHIHPINSDPIYTIHSLLIIQPNSTIFHSRRITIFSQIGPAHAGTGTKNLVHHLLNPNFMYMVQTYISLGPILNNEAYYERYQAHPMKHPPSFLGSFRTILTHENSTRTWI